MEKLFKIIKIIYEKKYLFQEWLSKKRVLFYFSLFISRNISKQTVTKKLEKSVRKPTSRSNKKWHNYPNSYLIDI